MLNVSGYAAVFFGAGLGGALRHAANRLLAPGATTLWSTLTVNVVGSFLIGLLAGWWAIRGDASQTTRLFLTTGVLGGFTTFSAFSLDVTLLWERGQVLGATAYALASVALSVAAVFAGIGAVRAM